MAVDTTDWGLRSYVDAFKGVGGKNQGFNNSGEVVSSFASNYLGSGKANNDYNNAMLSMSKTPILGDIMRVNPLFSNLFAGAEAAEAEKRKQGLIDDREKQLTTDYDNKVNQSFTDSAIGKSVTEVAKENLQEQNQIANNTAAVTGASDEAVLAAKSKNQEAFSKTLQQLASYGTARNDQLQRTYDNNINSLFNLKVGMENDNIEAASNASANSADTLSSVMKLVAL